MIRTALLSAVWMLTTALAAQQAPDILWDRSLGGTNNDVGRSMALTPDGGIVIVGGSGSVSATSTANMGDMDLWIVRMDANGFPLWHRNFGGSGSDIAIGVVVATDGSIIVLGQTDSPDGTIGVPEADADYVLIRLDADGEPQLIQRFSAGPSLQTGISDFVALSDGSFAAIGGKVIYPTTGAAHVDVMVLGLSATGNVLWSENYGGSGNDSGISITQGASGKLLCTGQTRSSDGDVTGYMGLDDGWLLEVSLNGQLIQQRTLGGEFNDQISSAVETNEGDIVVSGYYSYEMMIGETRQTSTRVVVEKISSAGESVWLRDYGGTNGDIGWHVRSTTDGGYLLFAYAYSNDGDVTDFGGTIDAWLIRLDADGELVWQRTFGGLGEEVAGDIVIMDDGGCLLLMGASGWNDEMSQYLGGNDTWLVRLGPEVVSVPDMASFGRPLDVLPFAGGYTAVVSPEVARAHCLVLDAAGRVVRESNLGSGFHSVRLDSEASGIYLVTLRSGQHVRTARVAKD